MRRASNTVIYLSSFINKDKFDGVVFTFDNLGYLGRYPPLFFVCEPDTGSFAVNVLGHVRPYRMTAVAGELKVEEGASPSLRLSFKRVYPNLAQFKIFIKVPLRRRPFQIFSHRALPVPLSVRGFSYIHSLLCSQLAIERC